MVDILCFFKHTKLEKVEHKDFWSDSEKWKHLLIDNVKSRVRGRGRSHMLFNSINKLMALIYQFTIFNVFTVVAIYDDHGNIAWMILLLFCFLKDSQMEAHHFYLVFERFPNGSTPLLFCFLKDSQMEANGSTQLPKYCWLLLQGSSRRRFPPHYLDGASQVYTNTIRATTSVGLVWLF